MKLRVAALARWTAAAPLPCPLCYGRRFWGRWLHGFSFRGLLRLLADNGKREQPKLGPLKEHIERMLEADRQAPRKQRHTAHRIWTRLCAEHPELPVAEPTVRRYVGIRRRELGLKGREVFVPQTYSQGQEAQVDWFEAVAKLDGENRKLQFFADLSPNLAYSSIGKSRVT